ncbi:MAG: hypothetical protein U0S12_13290 [Fimbriimonadales bacterium]
MLGLLRKTTCAFALLFSAVLAHAGTLTVTEPAAGTVNDPTLVGSNSKVKYNITGAVNSIRFSLRLVKLSDNSIVTLSAGDPVSPDADGKASGEIALSLDREQIDDVPYRLEVRAADVNGATTYNPIDLFVKPDLTKPKILEFNPADRTYVKGLVRITVRIEEPNLKEWRVQIDNKDIPNNTGTTVNANNEFEVTWDTTRVELDGFRNINVKVRDQADNETTKTIEVAVDRVAPTLEFKSPRSGSIVAPGTTINVAVDITDFSQDSQDASGIDVVVRDMNNKFILRVTRVQYINVGEKVKGWRGRIRWVQGKLPSQFKIIATAVDKAGNRANPQTITVRLGR